MYWRNCVGVNIFIFNVKFEWKILRLDHNWVALCITLQIFERNISIVYASRNIIYLLSQLSSTINFFYKNFLMSATIQQNFNLTCIVSIATVEHYHKAQHSSIKNKVIHSDCLLPFYTTHIHPVECNKYLFEQISDFKNFITQFPIKW